MTTRSRNCTSHIYGAERDLQVDEGWEAARAWGIAFGVVVGIAAGLLAAVVIWRA